MAGAPRTFMSLMQRATCTWREQAIHFSLPGRSIWSRISRVFLPRFLHRKGRTSSRSFMARVLGDGLHHGLELFLGPAFDLDRFFAAFFAADDLHASRPDLEEISEETAQLDIGLAVDRRRRHFEADRAADPSDDVAFFGIGNDPYSDYHTILQPSCFMG